MNASDLETGSRERNKARHISCASHPARIRAPGPILWITRHSPHHPVSPRGSRRHGEQPRCLILRVRLSTSHLYLDHSANRCGRRSSAFSRIEDPVRY